MPTVAQKKEVSSLPPVPEHDFAEGERVVMPLFGRKTVSGVVKYIDVAVGNRRYQGLAVLGDDGRYYEFHPEIARRA